MRTRTNLVIAAMAAACCSVSHAAEIFVDQGITARCDDYASSSRSCGDGEANAFPALPAALPSLEPGDVLYLRAGRYGQIRLDVSGTPSAPIEIRGMPAEEVIVTTDGEVALWLIDRSDVLIADLSVRQVEGFGRLENSTRIVIENVTFADAAASGTTGALKLVRSPMNRISGSRFEGGSDLLLLQDDSDRNVVSGNTFGRASHSLISVRCSGHNAIRGNVFNNPDQKALEIYDCEGVSDAPVRLDDTKRNLIEFNHFNGTAPAGQSHYFNAIQHGGQLTIVRYNLFTGNMGGGVNYQYYDQESLFVYGNRLYNNTFHGNRCYAVIGQSGSSRQFFDNRVTNNLMQGNTDCSGSRGQVSIRNRRQVILKGNAELDSDPGFEDVPAGDFRLRPDSRQVDAGAFVAKVTTDGYGTSLPVDDASWFYDGFGITGETGDIVMLEGQSTPVRVVAVDHENGVLQLAAPMRWRRGDGVHPAFTGSGPDVGAFETGRTSATR
jgi:hypothetical protein